MVSGSNRTRQRDTCLLRSKSFGWINIVRNLQTRLKELHKILNHKLWCGHHVGNANNPIRKNERHNTKSPPPNYIKLFGGSTCVKEDWKTKVLIRMPWHDRAACFRRIVRSRFPDPAARACAVPWCPVPPRMWSDLDGAKWAVEAPRSDRPGQSRTEGSEMTEQRLLCSEKQLIQVFQSGSFDHRSSDKNVVAKQGP